MISLRASTLVLELGRPAINKSDNAQASTSYLVPYVFAGISGIVPPRWRVPTYAMLGLLSVALTFGILAYSAKSLFFAAVVSFALLQTTTTKFFALNGWDHLLQGACLTSSIALLCHARQNQRKSWVAIASLLAAGTLFRPDGIIISVAVLIALRFSTIFRDTANRAFALYATIVGAVLLLNFVQFSHFTPTTARLKFGASPSPTYALNYLIDNGLLSFSAISVLAILVGLQVLQRRNTATPKMVVAGGAVISAAAAAINSDVFPGGRMFWTPACVIAVLMVSTTALRAPQWLTVAVAHARAKLIRWRFFSSSMAQRLAVGACLLCAIPLTTLAILDRAKRSTVEPIFVATSPIAQQYLVIDWIRQTLDPSRGAIGLFYLGMSYYLPSFEIADFLGKADESIAGTPVKWGPPGHNKWDIAQTILKWNPQVILPSSPSNPDDSGANEIAHARIVARDNWGFQPSLLVFMSTQSSYVYCYLRKSKGGVVDHWGMFVRNDIALEHSSLLRCPRLP